MKFALNDGTVARLKIVVQVHGYQMPYLQQPANAVEEIKRLAKKYMPRWPNAPLIVIGLEDRPVDELLMQARLPNVLSVGEFVSYRMEDGALTKPVFLHVVWLQDDMAPHMSDENKEAFSRIEWDRYVSQQT